jgi:glutamate--cysteine ligase/glutathione synthase
MMAEGYEGLELSTQLLIREAMNRRIEVEMLDWKDHIIRLKKGHKIEYVQQATKTSADTYISTLVMENKEVTKIILQEHRINVPRGITVYTKDEGLQSASQWTEQDLVIKPKSTNFGKGITILKQPYAAVEYIKAIQLALEHDQAALIESFIPGKEYRFLVIDNEVAAILNRVPANVIGDGVHSIEELVDQKNEDPLRGTGYVTPLEKIKLGETELQYLQQQNKDFSYIPQPNETVYLRENSNISTGGDSIDFTDEVLPDYKKIAIRSAKAVGAKICGIDIIIQNIHTKPDRNNYSVIELNFNPALHIHNFPYRGQNRFVEKKVLDLLGF